LDHIIAMKKQETTSYRISRDYFLDGARDCMSSTGLEVSPSERAELLRWAYEVVDRCGIKRQVAIMAISYLDRFLADNIGPCAQALSSCGDFQLCFVACFVIAVKICAGMNVEADFVTNVICQGLYQVGEIFEMEMTVLQGLSWRLNGPTAIDFVHAFLKLLPDQDDCKLKALAEEAEVQVELAMGDFSVALQDPSSIAWSSIILAINSGIELNEEDMFLWMQSVAMSVGGAAVV
jgi:hypothetical protein